MQSQEWVDADRYRHRRKAMLLVSGLVAVYGGAVLLAREGRPDAALVEWAILSVVLNGLAWGTLGYTRLRRREIEAHRERTEALLELRASQERFDAAFSCTSMGAVILDMNGTIVAANPALEAKLGHGDLTGRSYFDLLAPEDVQAAEALRRSLALGGPAARVERRFVTSAGEVMLAYVHASPLHDRAGKVEHAIVVVDDITERRSLRERLAKSERLAALGTLAAGVAHEINNPLAYMKANLCWCREALASGEYDLDEVSAALEETDRGAERIARIVGELSVFARAPTAPSPTDLRDAVDDAMRLASTKLRSVEDVSVELAPGLPAVVAVGRHLSQTLVNLLSNAVDAVEARSARDPAQARCIRVRAARDRDAVVVSVEDSGDGVDEDAMEHLFEPFFTTKGPSGTGLGLAISRENLSRFGATIEARRGPLGGALFQIRLACATPESLATNAAPRHAA